MKKFIGKAFFISAISLSLALCAASETATQPIEAHAATLSEKQNIIRTVSEAGEYSFLEKLDGDGNYDASNYVAKYVDTIQTSKFSVIGENELKLVTGSAVTGAFEYNPNLMFYADLSDNMQTAIKNGAIAIEAQAYLRSSCEANKWSGKDAPDKTYAELHAGSRNGDPSYSDKGPNSGAADENFTDAIVKESAENQGVATKEYLPYKASITYSELEGKDVNSLMFHTHAKFVSGGVFNQSNSIFVKDPVLKITTNDLLKPSVTEVKVALDGTVTLKASDIGSGIYSVVIKENGTEVSKTGETFSGDTRECSVVFAAEVGKTYEAVITDNVGNVSASPLKISEFDVKDLYTDKTFCFSAKFTDGYLCRYTLDGSEPVVSSDAALDGVNYVTVSENKQYVLKIKCFDEINNINISYEYNTEVNDRDYLIETNLKNCSLSVTETVKFRTTVSFEIVPNKDFELYKIILNGVEYDASYAFDLTVIEDIALEVVCRRRVSCLTPVQTVFVYDRNDVVLSYVLDGVDLSSFEFKYNGKDELPKSAGDYIVTWRVDNAEYVGEGSFTVTVESKKINIYDVVKEYVYGDTEFKYSASQEDRAVEIKFTLSDGTEVSKPTIPETYAYEFVSNDDSVVVTGSSSGEIVIKKAKIIFSVTSPYDVFCGKKEAVTVSSSAPFDIEDLYVISLTYRGNEADFVYGAGAYAYAITLTEEAAALYEAENAVGGFNVRQKEIVVKANKGQYKYYGDEDCAITYAFSEDLTNGFLAVGEMAREVGEAAGEYAISLGTLGVYDESLNEITDGYKLVLDSTETVSYVILSKKIIVKTSSACGVYGDSDPEFNSAVLYGFLRVDDKISVGRELGETVGEYKINDVTVLDGEENDVTDNYTVVVIAGAYTVTPKPVTVIPTGFTKTYGEPDGQISYTLSENIDRETLNFVLEREVGESAGAYEIRVAYSSNPNYAIFVEEAYCMILPAKITVTMKDYYKTYGESDPSFVPYGEEYTYAGIVFSREEGEAVGEYLIIVAEYDDLNYELEYFEASLTVRPQKITVSASGLYKTYGEEDPDFTFTVYGADKEVAEVKLERESGENAGVYAVSVSTNKNYEAVGFNAEFVIRKAEKILSLNPVTVVYNGDKQYVELTGGARATYRDGSGAVIEAPVNAGEYEVEVIFDGDENYLAATARTTLTILKKEVTVIIDASPVVYCGQPVQPSFTLSESVGAMVEWETMSPNKAGIYYYTITVISDNHYCKVRDFIIVL